MKYPYQQEGATDAQNTRRKWLTILAAVVVAGVVVYGLYWLLYARHFESTDDAYVGGDIVSITSRDPATVVALHADNTQTVRRGQLLVEFDPSKPEAAFEAAKAELARAVRGTRTNFSKVDQFRAQVNAARVALDQAQSDYRRRQTAGDSVSREELNHARDAVTGAEANLKAAESGLAQAQAAVQGTNVSTNPDVLAAIAQLCSAAITLSHMKLYAPVDGVIAQRTVQVGQQVAAGTPLMAVVPLDTVWIDANFKEGQLEDMRIGQPVTVSADIYGGSVTYHGKVFGLGAGSGSAFALLPPQNASGNWIKIVQRVPVRIALDPKELREHPLRLGLSVDVEVDVADTSGASIGTPNTRHEVRGYIGDYSEESIDRLIHQILAQNGA
ncbi:MAG TPA: HlyD family efflux transporter periplasmic adaptor subunit [Rhizomicrobium sp.]|nr:HlyD family efflux transporter periplasmic adaptor subunit [Rhizomicrobium sp.]